MEEQQEVMSYKDKYIGERKIWEVQHIDSKTFLGKPRVRVVFCEEEEPSKDMEGVEALLDFESEEYPLEMLEHIVTDEKSDATQLRIDKVNPVIGQILTVLAEAELTLSEVNYATGPRLKASIEQTMERIYTKFWGGKREPEVTLYDANEKIKELNVEKGLNIEEE